MLHRYCRFIFNNQLRLRSSNLFFKQAFPFSLEGEKKQQKNTKGENGQKIDQTQQKNYEFTEFQKNLLKNYKVNPVWNMLLELQSDYNHQKELILHRKQYQKSTHNLRAAILFEDLLKTQIDILIYDTKGKPYRWHLLKTIYIILTIALAYWGIDILILIDPKNKVILQKTTYGKIFRYLVYFACIFLAFKVVFRNLAFTKRYVQKIVYNTQREQFSILKRNFLGFKRPLVTHRYKMLYTEVPRLNRIGTNYFDIESKEEYSIVYKDSWVKQDLFSHLISQRIKV